MNREELVENIQFSKNKLMNLENMYFDLRQLQKPFIRFTWWVHVFAYIIYVFIAAKVQEIILTPFEPVLEKFINEDVYFYSFLVVSIITYIILYKFISKTLNLSKSFKSESRIEELKVQIADDQLALNTSIIPKGYQSGWYAQEIENLFLNHRADTIKEAINLLEMENKHRQSMQSLDSLKKLQIETLNQSRTANTLGWLNLLKR